MEQWCIYYSASNDTKFCICADICTVTNASLFHAWNDQGIT